MLVVIHRKTAGALAQTEDLPRYINDVTNAKFVLSSSSRHEDKRSVKRFEDSYIMHVTLMIIKMICSLLDTVPGNHNTDTHTDRLTDRERMTVPRNHSPLCYFMFTSICNKVYVNS